MFSQAEAIIMSDPLTLKKKKNWSRRLCMRTAAALSAVLACVVHLSR